MARDIYLICLTEDEEFEEAQAAIEKAWPNRTYRLTESAFFVAAHDSEEVVLTQGVHEKLQKAFGEDGPSCVVLSVTNYGGFERASVWEWLKNAAEP
ncbi:MAG: hypothetical protein OXI71_01955 [Gemmatimonadota bacterium]|nr:hypothetical protein [Gemmatimonadota bacterium]